MAHKHSSIYNYFIDMCAWFEGFIFGVIISCERELTPDDDILDDIYSGFQYGSKGT